MCLMTWRAVFIGPYQTDVVSHRLAKWEKRMEYNRYVAGEPSLAPAAMHAFPNCFLLVH